MADDTVPDARTQTPRTLAQDLAELDLVFSQPNGKPLFENNIRQRDLYPLCRRLGLPWRRALHNMRHGHGSHLLERDVPSKVVQERLGHKDAAFTLRTYAHVLRGMQVQAVRAVSAMLKASNASATPCNSLQLLCNSF